MRFYTRQHKHTCGVDLHARTMHVCILGEKGDPLVHRNTDATAETFLRTIAPYREDLVVGAECMYAWYWLADLCAAERIGFVLGHALYMKAIHGAKAKNDRIDSLKIATLLRGGTFPQAYVYPRTMRSTRDLLRRRLHFVRKRAELLAHLHTVNDQYNLPDHLGRIALAKNRDGLELRFEDPAVAKSVGANLELIDQYDVLIADLERYLLSQARVQDPDTLALLLSMPGIGRILGLTLLYEIHDIRRFPRVQEFASYARLVKCEHSSGGKRKGFGGPKIGNPHLKWAFSEAAVLLYAKCADAKHIVDRLTKKHGKAKALSIFAHKIGRCVYYMLKNRRAFHMPTFLSA
jgi:transposase